MHMQASSRSSGGSVKGYMAVETPELSFRALLGPSQLATTATSAFLLGLQAAGRPFEYVFLLYVSFVLCCSLPHILSCASLTGQEKTRAMKNRDAGKISILLGDLAGHLVFAECCGVRPTKRLVPLLIPRCYMFTL